MNKKKILLYTLIPFGAVAFVLLMVFLCSMHILHLSFVDETGKVFKEVTVVKSLYNQTVSAPNLLGYKFVSWEELDGQEFNVFQHNGKTVANYVTDTLEMPIVKVTTENGAKIKSKEVDTSSTISVMNAQEEYNFADLEAGIRLRGNSTLFGSKKAYRIKFNSKTNMLGLNDGHKFKSWVLLADWYDYSLTRNSLNFFIGNNLNIYCSDCTYVELFLNGDYKGVYLLCEQQQIDNYRIAVEEYVEGETEELNTGYLLENDYYYYEDEDFVIENTINGVPQDYTHWIVKSDTTKPEQLAYIQGYMQQVYDRIFSTASQSEIEELVDINSAVEMTIQQLYNGDPDANSSFYICKDKDGKIAFTAPWDADMSFGNMEHAKFVNGEIALNHLLQKLLEKDWFYNLVKARWNELQGLQQDTISYVQAVSTTYQKEFERNFKAYKNFFGKKNFFALAEEVKTFKNQQDASAYLVAWLENRFEKLNAFFN